MDFAPYIVYIKTDGQSRITDVNSSAFLLDATGWTEIDSGYGDRYHHAQGNYFDRPIRDERGICRYLHTPDAEPKWRERTQEEMDADYVPPEPQPDLAAEVASLKESNRQLKEALELLLSGATEEEEAGTDG